MIISNNRSASGVSLGIFRAKSSEWNTPPVWLKNADGTPPRKLPPKMPRVQGVEVRFEVGRLEEVLRWVLSFGSQAKVLGPPELVKMVRDEVEAMRG